jgi:hypothetical protein
MNRSKDIMPYRALRSRYDALLVALYERTSLTLREIAGLAGRTDRAVGVRVRALGCLPRNARTCRPGTNVGLRRAGPRLSPLNRKAARRAAAAFAEVARALSVSALAHAAAEVNRATARAARRTARAQNRVMASAARELTYIATAMEDTAATRQALAGARKAKSVRAGNLSRASAGAPKPRSLPDAAHEQDSRAQAWQAQERVLRAQEARMWAAHEAARRAEADPAAPAAAPPRPPDGVRRSDGMAEHGDAGPQKPPRVRRLW